MFQSKGATRWEDQTGVLRCEITFLRGGEEVIAGRLAGINTVVIRGRRTALQAATTHWQIKDNSSGQLYEIKSVIPTEDGRSLDFTCQSKPG